MKTTPVFSISQLIRAAGLACGLFALSPAAHALDPILREYQSIRSSGMGGVRMTTGLYDENFFNNPARITANPTNKFQLMSLMAELSNPTNVSSVVSSITGGGDVMKALGTTAGSITHARVQTSFPAFYLASKDERKWALGIGVFSSTQLDIALRNNFQIVLGGITDVGPAITFGYKFLKNKLSVGTTAHVVYRMATIPNLTFAQILKGQSLSPTSSSSQGGMVDFDLGATYELPLWESSPYRFTVGASMTNLLGGDYSNLSLKLVPGLTCNGGTTCLPPASSRALGLGVAASRETWGAFTRSVLALEFTDIFADSTTNLAGSTPNAGVYGTGSLFRTIHLGGETHWKIIALRAGFNQGYLAAGLGFDFRFMTLDFSTYGEEMTLNVGGTEDRRYALQVGFQI